MVIGLQRQATLDRHASIGLGRVNCEREGRRSLEEARIVQIEIFSTGFRIHRGVDNLLIVSSQDARFPSVRFVFLRSDSKAIMNK